MSPTARLRLFLLILIIAVSSLVYFVSRYTRLDDTEPITIITNSDSPTESSDEVVEEIEDELDERNQGNLLGIVGSVAAGLLSVWGVMDTFWREVGGMRKLQLANQELQNEKLKLEIEKLKSDLKATRPHSDT